MQAPQTQLGDQHVGVIKSISAGLFGIIMMLAASGAAAADPMMLRDLTQFRDTADGWHFTLSMTEISVNAVPNMAATPFTKEGFVSAKVQVTIDGQGAMPVNSGSVVLGAQLGCKVKLDEGMDLSTGNNFDLLETEDPSLNLSPYVGIDLRPGYIRTTGLGAKRLKGRTATITIRDAHISIDGCGGAVAFRLFAWSQMSTDTSDDSLNVYGDLVNL